MPDETPRRDLDLDRILGEMDEGPFAGFGSRWYIMRPDGTVYHEPNTLKAALWYQKAERHIADDTIDGVRVSTVFLSLDHNHSGEGPPILFETLTFGTDDDHELMRRYCTRDEALLGHLEVMNQVKQWASMMKKKPSAASEP